MPGFVPRPKLLNHTLMTLNPHMSLVLNRLMNLSIEKYPTTGIYAIALSMFFCDRVSIVGFDAAMLLETMTCQDPEAGGAHRHETCVTRPSQNRVLHRYFDPPGSDSQGEALRGNQNMNPHNWTQEALFLKSLVRAEIVHAMQWRTL